MNLKLSLLVLCLLPAFARAQEGDGWRVTRPGGQLYLSVPRAAAFEQAPTAGPWP